MRFRRRQRIEAITLTQRKAAAFERKQRRERERYPLFADEIWASQRSIEDEFVRRNRIAIEAEVRSRDFYADVWKRARGRFFAATAECQAATRAFWKAWTGPCEATYFSYAVDFCTGEYERRSNAARDNELALRKRGRVGMGVQSSLGL